MPVWFEGIPTIAALFAAAVAAAMVALWIARFLGLDRLAPRLSSLRAPGDLVERLASLADVGKKEGLLSLEGRINASEEPLVACGVALALEGADIRVIREALDAEIDAVASRKGLWSRLDALMTHGPGTLIVSGSALLLITLIVHAQNPSASGVATIAAGGSLFFLGVVLIAISPFHSARPRSRAASETLSALIQSTGVLLICSGADGNQTRARLIAMLPGTSPQSGGVAQAA